MRRLHLGFWTFFTSMLILVVSCVGGDLEDEKFACIDDDQCADGFVCRQSDDQRICLAEDSADVELCERYCDLTLAKCTSEETSIFEDRQECLSTCDGIPSDGNQGDTTGNTVQCRLYHLGVAGQDDTLHCPHSWEYARSGGCTGDCFDYCKGLIETCGSFSDDEPKVPNPTELEEEGLNLCQSVCSEYPRTQDASADTGHSLECRQTWLIRAQDLESEGDTSSSEFDTACRNAGAQAANEVFSEACR